MQALIQYPSHLPPDSAFYYLSVAQQAEQSRCILRTTKDPITYDDAGLIAADLVQIPGSKQLLDYSVNLLGTFQLADRAWRTDHLSWQPGQSVQTPTGVQYNGSTDWYAVVIAKLHGQQVLCAAVPGGTLQCYVCHDPTHANYWHFVIRFADTSGTNLKSLALSGSAIKKIMADLRAWMRQIIGLQPQQLVYCADVPIPLSCCQYVSPDSCP